MPSRSRRFGWRRLALRVGVPLTAVAAAAAVIAAVVVQGSTGPRPVANLGIYHAQAASVPTPAAGASGRDILLTAARTVATAAATPGAGRYWETSSVVGNFIRVGPINDRYVILERTAVQDWAARDPQGMSQDFNQRLGVLLASAADRQARRRDGSPGSWNISQETSVSDPAGYASGGGKVQAGRGSLTNFFGETGGPFVVGDRSYSPQALLNLPSDPTRLKALLLTGYRHAFGSVDSYLFGVTPGVLTLP